MLLIVALVGVAWCLLPLPLAIAIGRSFRAGELSETDRKFEEIVRGYDAAGV
jgi:hypothetical protein